MADLSNIWNDEPAAAKAPETKAGISRNDALRLLRGETNILTPTVTGVAEAGAALATGVPAWLYGRITNAIVRAQTGSSEAGDKAEEETIKRFSYEPRTDFGKHLTGEAGKVMEPLFVPGQEVKKSYDKAVKEARNPTEKSAMQILSVPVQTLTDLLVPVKAGKAAKAIVGERGTFGAKPEIKTAADYRKANESFAAGETKAAQEKAFAETEAARAGSPEVADAIREEYGIPDYVAALKDRLKSEGVKVQERADLSDIWTEGEREAYGTTAEVPKPEPNLVNIQTPVRPDPALQTPALPAGQGFTMKDAPEPRYPQPQEPLALPAGQGFEIVKEKPEVVRRREPSYNSATGLEAEGVEVEYAPMLTGQKVPYKSAIAAKAALKKRGLDQTHEVIEVEGGFGLRRKAAEAPKPAEAPSPAQPEIVQPEAAGGDTGAMPGEPAPIGRAGIRNQRGSSNLITDAAKALVDAGEFGFDFFSDMAEGTADAIKIAAKEAPKAGAFAGEREKGKYAIGEVVKHRSVTGAKGEKLNAPPVFEGEKAIVQGMPDLPKKPMGGWTENPLRTFEQLGTKAKELIYRPVKEAEKAWHTEMTDLRAEVKKVKEGTGFFSGDRIGAYAIAQQKRGKAILDAMGKKAPELTPKEKEVYNFMRGKFDELYNRLQEARKISGLEPFGKQENYFTFFNDLSALQEMGFNPITTPMAVMDEAFVHLKATPFGFAKKRTVAIHPIKTDAFLVFDRYADKAIQHINLSPVVAKGRELMGSFDDGFILKNEKPATAKFITDWLDYVAGQKPPQPLPAPVERGLQTINKNLAFSILSANIRSALIQPSSLINTVAEIGTKHTMQGIAGLLEFSEGKRSAVSEAMKKSNVLLGREFDVNVMESMASVKGALSGARQKAGEIGMKPLQLLDMETARATWIGAYKKAKAEGRIEKDAINYADDTVTRTQASAQRSDISPVQRTTVGKTLTLFQTFTINNWGFLTRDVLGIGNKELTNKEAFGKAARWVVGATLINSLFEDVLGTQSPLPSPIHEFIKNQEEGGTIPESAMKAALEGATVAPFLGGARFGSSPFGATADFAKDVVVKASDKKGPKKTWAELTAKALGVPGTAQVAKTIRGLEYGKTPEEALLGTEKRAMDGSRKLKRSRTKALRSLRGLD